MVILEVMLPLPPVQLSPRKRGGHWAVDRKFAAEYKNDCLAVLRSQKMASAKEITLHWTLFTARLRNSRGRVIPDGLYRPKDKDNAIAALKYAQDAIVAARIVADDDSPRVNLGGLQIIPERDSKGKRGALLRIEASNG
jgi:hypothetical protein